MPKAGYLRRNGTRYNAADEVLQCVSCGPAARSPLTTTNGLALVVVPVVGLSTGAP
jgi:hypothetical protein